MKRKSMVDRRMLKSGAGGLRRLGWAVFLFLLGGAALAGGAARIVSPAQEETVHDNEGRVTISVANAPADVRFQAVLDGKPVGTPASSPDFEIEGVERGTHRLVVNLIGHRGAEEGRTQEIEFYLWQASALAPNRVGR